MVDHQAISHPIFKCRSVGKAMKGFIIAVLASTFIGLVLPGQADAIPTLQFSNGLNTLIVADGDIGDLDARTGYITVSSNLDGWSIFVKEAFVLGPVVDAGLMIDYISLSSIGAGTLTTMFSNTGISSWESFFAATAGTTAGTIEYSTFMDSSNNLFATTTLLSSFSGFGGQPVGPITGIFSLTQVITVTHTSTGTTNFIATMEVPESESALFFTLSFLALAFAKYRFPLMSISGQTV